MLLLLLTACATDSDLKRTDGVTPGSPATITLRISTPEANTTRSDREAHFYEVRSDATTDTSEKCPSQSPTRADVENPLGLDNELINSWWIAFVKDDGTVAKIINGPENLTPTNEDTLNPYTMDSGKYMMYAFANISPDELKTHTGIDFESGNVPAYDLKDYVFSGISNYTDNVTTISAALDNGNAYRPKFLEFGKETFEDKTPRPLIPMSGCQEVTITDGKLVDIEVRRMLAKMQIELKNSSKLPIKVKDVYIGRFTTGDIFLFDRNADENKPDPFFLPGKGYDPAKEDKDKQIDIAFTKISGEPGDTLERKYLSAGLYADTEDIQFAAKDKDGSTARHLFYLNESIANYFTPETETFFIEIKMTRVTELATEAPAREAHFSEMRTEDSTDTSEKCPSRSKTRAFEEDDDEFNGVKPNVVQKIVVVPATGDNYFTSIRRNDYVVFPIEITDVVVDFIPSYYPPIGGYPQVTMKDTEDYTEFFFDEGGEGFFSITPMVFADIKKTEPLAVQVEVPLYVYDTDGIFSKKPTCTDGTDITGELSGKTFNDGEPHSSEINVRLRVTLVLDDGSTKEQTYVRRIKITVGSKKT